MITETIFVAIGTVVVLARLYVRSHVIKSLGLDDLFIVLGLVEKPNPYSTICNAKHHRLDLRHLSPCHGRPHGSLRSRATSVLSGNLTTTAIRAVASHKMAVHIPSSHDTFDHVYKSLYMCLPSTHFWHETFVEMVALRHHGILGCDKRIQCIYRAGTMFAGSKALGSADTRHLLGPR